MTKFWENRCNVVVYVISALRHSLRSRMTPLVIYSIGLFASLSLFFFFFLSLLCSGRRDRFTWAGFFEVKMPTTPRCSQSSSNQGLIPVIKI